MLRWPAGGTWCGGLALARTRHVQDSEDVFQEVFARFFRHEGELQSDEHRKGLAHPLHPELYQHPAVRPLAELAASGGSGDPGRGPGGPAVYRAVLELPRTYRTAIHLHYYEGYSVSEIASLTGAKEGTVKSWLSRGRRSWPRP